MDGLSSYNRFLSGDNQGLGELVEMYNHSLILFINGYVNDYFVSEDLAADTFMEIFIKRYQFKETARLKTWLFRIGRNNAYDYLRKQSRTYTIGLDDAGDIIDSKAAGNPEETLLTNERNRALHEAMSVLHEDYRHVLYLIYFEGMGYDEVGSVLRKSNRQVKNLAYRAKKSLKSRLEEGGFSYEEFKES
jgi:RNA polymerase sigma-70 factor (ECF subfamily)